MTRELNSDSKLAKVNLAKLPADSSLSDNLHSFMHSTSSSSCCFVE